MIETYKRIKELGLECIYLYVMNNNKSFNLPYHNNYHLERVCKFSLIGANAYSLSIDEQKNIAIASLFHDVNHTGSGKDDDLNIKNACNAYYDFFTKRLPDIEGKSQDKKNAEQFNKIISLIKSTRYPYIEDGNKIPLINQIIRDADILQGIFSTNYINGIVLALATEAKMTYQKIFDVQGEFMKNASFYTDWATNLYAQQLPIKLKEFYLVKEMMGYEKL